MGFDDKKNDALKRFSSFVKIFQNEKGFLIRSCNVAFKKICEDNGFSHDSSSPNTPQQDVVLKENRILQEFVGSMLKEY